MLTTPGESGDVAAAWELHDELIPMLPESLRDFRGSIARVMVAGVLMRAEMADSANAVLSRVDRSEEADPQGIILEYEAGMRASTGDLEGGLEALRRSLAATSSSTMTQDRARHWWWRDLQGEPAFRSLLEPSE